MNIRLMMMISRLLESNQDNGGGDSSTSSVPSSNPPSVAAPATDGGDFDFADLATHDDDAPEPVSTPSSGTAPTPVAPVASASSAPSTPNVAAPVQNPPIATVPPVQSPPTPPVTESQPAPGTVPATSEEGGASSNQPVLTFEQHRAQFLPKLRELYNNFTPEQVEKLRTNPEEVLPDLAANLHYETQLAVHNSVMTALPNIIGMVLKERETQTKHNDAFYGMWPKLKEAVGTDPAKENVIRGAIRAYRNAHPNAKPDEIMQKAGLLAMMSLQIPIEQAGAVAAAGTSAAPPTQVSAPTPPRPPGVSSVGHISPQGAPGVQNEENIFADLTKAWENGEI